MTSKVVLWFLFPSTFLDHMLAGMLQFELLIGLSYCNPADEFDNKVHVVGNVYQHHMQQHIEP